MSYLDYQGQKLVERFDPNTYRVLAGAMDRHDLGRARGGIRPALVTLAEAGVRLTGVGIGGDLLYGPTQVRELVAQAIDAGLQARYRRLRSTKGHDAFLVEWSRMGAMLREALGVGR